MVTEQTKQGKIFGLFVQIVARSANTMETISINEIIAVDRTSIGPDGRVYIDKNLAGRDVKVVVIDEESVEQR